MRYPTKKQSFSLEKEPYFWKQSAKIWNRRTQKFIPHPLIISCPVNRALPVFLVNDDGLELKWDFRNGLAPYLLLKVFFNTYHLFFFPGYLPFYLAKTTRKTIKNAILQYPKNSRLVITTYVHSTYQRGCREVVRYEYFVAIIPVFSTFSNFFKKKYI